MNDKENIKLVVGLDRSEMHLSNGEQNFISLAFALLLARNSEKEFVVLDDPISSFDSVYKNKISALGRYIDTNINLLSYTYES